VAEPERPAHSRGRWALVESAPMSHLPPPDLGFAAETLLEATRLLVEACEDLGEPPALPSPAPEIQAEALRRLLGILRRFDTDEAPPPDWDGTPAEPRELHALGDHGLRLLADLCTWAQALHQSDALRGLRLGILALARWLARRGAELTALAPLVDALAAIANTIRTPPELERLFVATRELLDATSPAIAQDLERANPGRPWRLLVLNQAIIATRSHQPLLMEQAFQFLVEALPEDAANFFREGMEQMEALDYPAPVRQVMEKYFQLWCTPKTLH
jgi:hypothetical protein